MVPGVHGGILVFSSGIFGATLQARDYVGGEVLRKFIVDSVASNIPQCYTGLEWASYKYLLEREQSPRSQRSRRPPGGILHVEQLGGVLEDW